MRVVYKCSCMKREAEIDVPNRRDNTPMEAWIEMVRANVGFDHTQLSPYCRAGKAEYIKVPMTDTGETTH